MNQADKFTAEEVNIFLFTGSFEIELHALSGVAINYIYVSGSLQTFFNLILFSG